MSKLVKCKTCEKQISKTALMCPYCGEIDPGLYQDCPKCKSTNISSTEKGFNLCGAAVGTLLLGPFGLLGGMIGRKKIVMTCLDCGENWWNQTIDQKSKGESS